MKQYKEALYENFKDLEFDAGLHKYSLKGEILPSVSSKVSKFCNKFEAEKIAGFVAKSRKCTKEEVLKEWKTINEESLILGNQVHEFAENYGLGQPGLPFLPQEKAVVKFWEDLPTHIVPISFELRMFSEEFMYAGTADVILYDTLNEKVIIADYKTNKDLYKHYSKYLKAPFNNMIDCSLNKYQIQLSYYKIMLEEAGYEVSETWIIWVKPDESYNLIKTTDLTKELKDEDYRINTKSSEFIL